MANQSMKRNQQKIKTPVLILTSLVYVVTIWLLLFNLYYAFSQQISLWHLIPCAIVAFLNIFCLQTVVKYWELQASEAAQYHLDILIMNIIVSIFDPWTHKVWHIYWLVLVFLLSFVAKWLWGYITPKYEEQEEGDQAASGKKEKKEKKEKIKYLKK